MIKVRGYMFSRNFMGERVPQHIQNNIIRNYCMQNNLHYMLSAVEYAMDSCYLILNQVVKEKNNIKGIGFYSVFQLPGDDDVRVKIMKEIIKREKTAHFCTERLTLRNFDDMNRINTIWLIKKNLKYCLNDFSSLKKGNLGK
tara:strand:- start:9047 stop:9472 length:426 start_codon:yes stop_codon:yes gene_type:complete